MNLINPLSANPTKWLNTLKQLIDNLPTNCLSVFNHFVELALKELSNSEPYLEPCQISVMKNFEKKNALS